MDELTRKIGTDALHLAQRGNFAGAAEQVAKLNRSGGLLQVLCAWIDTMILHVYPGHRGKPIMLRFGSVETGKTETADEVDWSIAWAGRLVSSRAAGDEESFMAVLRSVPEGAALGDGIMALLNIVSTSVNDPQRIRAWARRVQG